MIPSLIVSFDQLIWCKDESIKQYCAEIVAGLLAVLVNLGSHTQRDIYLLGRKLLTSIVEKVIYFLNRCNRAVEVGYVGESFFFISSSFVSH